MNPMVGVTPAWHAYSAYAEVHILVWASALMERRCPHKTRRKNDGEFQPILSLSQQAGF
jgi:hypothetical protein